MADKTARSMRDSLHIIWTIASKDVVDALKNRVVLSMIVILITMLMIPKLLPLIFEQTQLVLPVYDQGHASWLEAIKNNPDLSVQEIHSEQEFQQSLCSSLYPEIGLILPVNYDPRVDEGEAVTFQAPVCWNKRHQVSSVQPKLEELLSVSLGKPVRLNINGNVLYPPEQGGLYLSLATVNSIALMLMIGVFSVPSLLFEEKETKTMQALLVSPASIMEVVAGKALAGLFNSLVCAVLIFLVSWVDVIHWDMVLLFVFSAAVFSVAVGLVLGSFFEKQQDVVGWMVAILLILIGAVLIKALGIELPSLGRSLLNWIPSVALAEIYRAALSETVNLIPVWTSFGIVLIISLFLYVSVIFIIKRQLVR